MEPQIIEGFICFCKYLINICPINASYVNFFVKFEFSKILPDGTRSPKKTNFGANFSSGLFLTSTTKFWHDILVYIIYQLKFFKSDVSFGFYSRCHICVALDITSIVITLLQSI